MRLICRSLLLIALWICASAQAQIYTCVAEDGTKVFSDQRCGSDAQVVKGVTTKKKPEPKAKAQGAQTKTPRTTKPVDELKALSAACDGGDMKACKEWTLGGGPQMLKKQERQAELDCEAGSLSACEQRYCSERVDADCRARVLRTAKLAGETWYLRDEQHEPQQGVTRYEVRCVPENQPIARDVTVQCRALPGPDRCSVNDVPHKFARLDKAAAKVCSG